MTSNECFRTCIFSTYMSMHRKVLYHCLKSLLNNFFLKIYKAFFRNYLHTIHMQSIIDQVPYHPNFRKSRFYVRNYEIIKKEQSSENLLLDTRVSDTANTTLKLVIMC